MRTIDHPVEDRTDVKSNETNPGGMTIGSGQRLGSVWARNKHSLVSSPWGEGGGMATLRSRVAVHWSTLLMHMGIALCFPLAVQRQVCSLSVCVPADGWTQAGGHWGQSHQIVRPAAQCLPHPGGGLA